MGKTSEMHIALRELEEFRDIENYEGLYQVSNNGRVKSLNYSRTGKEGMLNPKLEKNNYYRVSLSKNSKKKVFLVHQLVAVAFLNHKICGHNMVVNHKNFIKTDNRLCNLEIITNRENTNKKHIKSSSEYVGVYWDKGSNKWKSQITINGNRKNLGRFKTEIEAYKAYEKTLNITL
jgi:hypothetical protein